MYILSISEDTNLTFVHLLMYVFELPSLCNTDKCFEAISVRLPHSQSAVQIMCCLSLLKENIFCQDNWQ